MIKILKKISLILLRLAIVASLYFSVKYLMYRNFKIEKGVIVASGYYKYTYGRHDFSYSHYPIVAFIKPGETSSQINIDSISPSFDEIGGPIAPVGNIYFTQPPPNWHLDEPTIIGDSMDYYYAHNDFKNAKVLSFRSYWLSESAIYWMLIAVFVWTVAADLYRINRKEKTTPALVE